MVNVLCTKCLLKTSVHIFVVWLTRIQWNTGLLWEHCKCHAQRVNNHYHACTYSTCFPWLGQNFGEQVNVFVHEFDYCKDCKFDEQAIFVSYRSNCNVIYYVIALSAVFKTVSVIHALRADIVHFPQCLHAFCCSAARHVSRLLVTHSKSTHVWPVRLH